MRHSDPRTHSGQNKGLKGDKSAESKTRRKKRSTSISIPNFAPSKFLPVYLIDLRNSKECKEVEFHCYSIQNRFDGKKMRDKIQTISTKESNQSEISELPQMPVKFASDIKIMKCKNSASLNPLKQPGQSTCFEQDLNLPQHKLAKKSSKRRQDDVEILTSTSPDNAVCRIDGNSSLEVVSKTEILSPSWTISKRNTKNTPDVEYEPVSELVSEKVDRKYSAFVSEDSNWEVRKKRIWKNTPEQEKRQSSSFRNDDDVSVNSLSEKQETNVLDKSKRSTKRSSANLTIQTTSPHNKEKLNTSLSVVDTSTPKTISKNKQEFFPHIAFSPKQSTPKLSKLPFLTGGFVLNARQRTSSKSLYHSEVTESSSSQDLNKSMNSSSNSISFKVISSDSYNSDKDSSSADPISNVTFSSTLDKSNWLATPKTPEASNSMEIREWKQRRGMSDIGPRSYKNLAWRDSVHNSSNALHASLLDTPPYARHRERLLDNRHILPKRYSQEHLRKYSSFQHRSSLAKVFDWKSAFLDKCWSLKNNFIDSHCHLDFLFDRLPFDGSFKKYYRKNLDTFPINFAGCVAVFCEPKSFTSEGLWKVLLRDDNVWLAMGCHPKKAIWFDTAAEKGLEDCIKHPKVVAVGEIGLDYSGRFIESAEIQKKVLVCQIKMALAVKKPLVIHCRDAQDDCLQILKKHVPSDYRIHCHCFTKSFKFAKEWLALFPNLYIGLTPLVTYPSAKEVHDTAQNLPLERLLLETDAPYFVPKFVPRGMMKFSHPGLAISVAFEVAKLKGTNVETVLKHCLENTKQMYGI